MGNVIEINHLSKYYGQTRGIADVSFEVHDGEIFGFIGPNGAGKSTTIRTLLGLIHPTSGTASIFGRDVFRCGNELRRDIGYLPSEVFYYDRMKAGELLRYSASFYGKVNEARLKDLAGLLNLDLNRKIEDLSYGNKKKVGIIQGLLHEPKLIILDEPTSGLDPLMQRTFFELIRQENARGATILMSSHNLPEVQKLCSRVAIIQEGKIIEVQDIAVLRSTAYKKIHAEFAGEVPASLKNLPNVRDFQNGSREADFLFGGDINEIVRLMGRSDLLNLTITEPDLEEIFLHYYDDRQARP